MSLAEATSLQEHAAERQRHPVARQLTASAAAPAAVDRPGTGRSSPQRSLANASAADTDETPYIAEHNPQADAEVLEQLAQWCERFSPLVGFEHLDPFHNGSSPQQRRSDCLYLDVTNVGPYFGSEQKLARLVAESFSQRGYLARVTIADTLGAAWALAHFAIQDATVIGGKRPGSQGPEESSTQVPKDPKTQGPKGQSAQTPKDPKTQGPRDPGTQGPTAPGSSFLVVPPGATWTALQPLPVQSLRLPDNIQSVLEQLGIFQIAQLASLPRASLLSRFGDVLLKRWDQACGHVAEVLLVHHPTPQFRTDWALEHPTTSQAAIQSILATLTERLSKALKPRGEGVIQCLCRLTCTPPLTPSPSHSPPPPLTPSPPHSPLSPSLSHPLTPSLSHTAHRVVSTHGVCGAFTAIAADAIRTFVFATPSRTGGVRSLAHSSFGASST